MATARAARWGRGALGILLTYALFLQLVFAGMVAERMAFAAPVADPICAAAGHGGIAPDGADTSSSGHRQACVVCAFAGLAPPLPERIITSLPAAVPLGMATPLARHGAAEARPAPSPRTSQGPPVLG